MVTIDLSTPPPPAASFIEGLPRRLALTLPELRLVAELAGGAPLPFEHADELSADEPPAGGALADRLGGNRESEEAQAYATALGSLHEPDGTLQRRGLLTDGQLDPGIAGAVGLLATPSLALDIDVASGGAQVKAWHRYDRGAVATLSTCDGIVFELAWFPSGHWTDELARVTAVPEDLALRESAVPALLDLPYAIVDAVGEAVRSGRTDLVPVLVSQSDQDVLADGAVLREAEASAMVAAIHTESRGRLRILAAEIAEQTTDVGVVSWVLLADGWHSITPRHDGGVARVSLRRVDPADLATELAPVLAQVTQRPVQDGAA